MKLKWKFHCRFEQTKERTWRCVNWNYPFWEIERQKNGKNEHNQKDWDTTMNNSICIMEVPGGKERDKGAERIFEETMRSD